MLEEVNNISDRKIKISEVASLAETLTSKELSNVEGAFVRASKEKDKTFDEEEK